MWPHKDVPSRAGGRPGAAWGLAAAPVEGIFPPGTLTASLTILPAWALQGHLTLTLNGGRGTVLLAHPHTDQKSWALPEPSPGPMQASLSLALRH